jgi:thymidylate synthase ThyX
MKSNMKATLVSLLPTEQARAAGRTALTPELLAASGARYSRNNEGLESILARIDPDNMDRSVDSIFRMVDYGHQSIADMAPVAIFLDNISIWLACHVWSLCPTAGGQESSTRYIEIDPDAMPDPESLGIPATHIPQWRQDMQDAFTAYRDALAFWESIGETFPERTAIPKDLLIATDDKSSKTVARMLRNYRFDRARYFLPAAASTNMMMVMSARGWVQLCQYLLSNPLPEPHRLGTLIQEELALASPRLLKHATRQEGIATGIWEEFLSLARQARSEGLPATLAPETVKTEADPVATIDISVPPDVSETDVAAALAHHHNRYGWTGTALKRIGIRYHWSAMALGEIRDLNRHRTGNRYLPALPVGFYGALDQLPANPQAQPLATAEAIRSLQNVGRRITAHARESMAREEPSAIYYALLGSQFPFERCTTADKFIYESELRTGVGAHYRYARHYRDALALWYARFPATRGLILEGSAEPE